MTEIILLCSSIARVFNRGWVERLVVETMQYDPINFVPQEHVDGCAAASYLSGFFGR